MRAAIYARVSTPRQVQSQSLEAQLERLKAYVESQGWQLAPEHVYRDDGYSGAKLNRPGLDRLRDQAGLAEFEMVVVTAPDRLSRNYVHQMLLMEEWRRQGIQLEFLDRPMSDDPHDRLLLQIRGAVAEYERTLISERMRRGRLAKYRAGQLLPWGRRVYGYQVDPEHPRDPGGVQLDAVEAVVVTQIFENYLEFGATLYRVAKQLTDLGLPSPSGKPIWQSSSVRGILTNAAYTGIVYANRLQTVPATRRASALHPVGGGQSTVLKPETDWIAIPIPAIIDQDIFDQVQAKLALNQQAAPRNNQHPYLLRGLVSCGQCRLSARVRTLHGKYPYYVCHSRAKVVAARQEPLCTARYAPAAQLDALVWQELCQVLTEPKLIAGALERAHGGQWLPQELQARLKNQQQAQQQLARQQDRLLEAYLAEVIQFAEFERKRQELTHKQTALQQQAAQLQATAVQRAALGQTFTSIETFCQRVQQGLIQATFDQKRELIELLIDRVIITDAVVEIRYVFPTQPDGPHHPFSHLRTDYRPVTTGHQGDHE